MKKILTALMLLLGASAFAQNTTVSATVTDTDGIVWANGTWKMDFKPVPGDSESIYNINGTPLDPAITHQSGVLSGTGTFSSTVYPNSIITPAKSTWTVTVCPNAVTSCGSYNFTASGSSMNLSSVLTSIIPAPRFNPVSGTYGYADIEAQIQLAPGSTYWNVTSACQRFYNKTATSWACSSTGGGGGGVSVSAPAKSIQIADAGAANLTSDPYITADKVTHTLYVGGPITGEKVHVFTVPPIPASWDWDWSTPSSALASLGPVPYNDIAGPNGSTQFLCLNGASPSITTTCNAPTGTVSSVALNTAVITTGTGPLTVTGSPITTSGVFNMQLNTSGVERSLVTSGGAGTPGYVAVWNTNGGLSATPPSSLAGSATDYYWTVSAPCSVGGGNSVACVSGGTAILQTHLPGNMPDASYQLFITADVSSFSGSAAPSFMCTGLNANSTHTTYSLPVTSAGTLYYHCTSVLSNGGTGGSPVVYFHAHHN